MLRYALLASALAITTPAFAQETPSKPADEQMTPETAAPATTPAPQEMAPATEEAMPTAQAQPAPQAAPAQPTSVAEVVKAEFPSYDKDSTGDLSKAEFSQWLIALKTKAEPAASTDQAAMTAWAGKAFSQADKDKSASVTETELTSFLTGAG